LVPPNFKECSIRYTWKMLKFMKKYCLSLCTNPLAQNPRQVKLDSDKWKLWKNLYEEIENFLNLAFGQVGEKNEGIKCCL
jgi:hypothetical protein